MIRFLTLTAMIIPLAYINDTRGAWGIGPSRSTCTVGITKTFSGSNGNNSQALSPAITNLVNNISMANTNLAAAGTFYGGHKGKAIEELNKALKMINIYAPQTKNIKTMAVKESSSSSQSQGKGSSVSDRKLRQAKQAIENSIEIMYATRNPSFENQLLVSYFKRASKEIDLALKY